MNRLIENKIQELNQEIAVAENYLSNNLKDIKMPTINTLLDNIPSTNLVSGDADSVRGINGLIQVMMNRENGNSFVNFVRYFDYLRKLINRLK